MSSVAPLSAAGSFVQRLLATDAAEQRRALIASHELAPDDVREAVLTLVAEAEALMGAHPPRMERICLDALALAERAGDAYLHAMAGMRYGDALRAQGRNPEALARFEEAAATFTRLGLPVEAARSRIGWVWVAASLGRFEEALKAARTARRVLLAHGELFRAANLLQSIGGLYLRGGRYRAALRAFTAAQALYLRVGEHARRGLAQTHANRGLTLNALGRQREALMELELARDVYRAMGEHAGMARVLRSIGEHHLALGRYAAALRAFEDAQAAMRALDSHADTVHAALGMADCYLRLNRPSDALDALDQIADDLRRTGNPQDALGVAVRRVTAHVLLGERGRAATVLDEAVRQFATGGLQPRALLAGHRAQVLLADGAPAEALAEAREAVRLARTAGTRWLLAENVIIEATALLELGNPGAAEQAARRARRLARAIDSASLLHRAYEVLGQAAEATGSPARARRAYHAAIQQLERDQRGVIFEFRDAFAAGRSTVYERLASLELAEHRPAEAFLAAERAKSRAILDAIVGVVQLRPRGSGTVRRLLRELAEARDQYAAAFARRQHDEVAAMPRDAAGASAHELTALEARISGLVRQLQITEAAGDIADLYTPVAEVSLPRMPEGTALVEFFLSGADILRFVVDAHGVRGDRLPGAVTEVERLLRSYRVNLDATERAVAHGERAERLARQARAVLGALYTLLFGDLAIRASWQQLVIVPHGLLHYLPFHALHDGAQYLIERVAISYAPSAALYTICRERAARAVRGRWGALVLAHSADGQLPHALAEAQAVSALLKTEAHVEHAATRTLLHTVGRRAGVIHIAAHGRFRQDAPLFSGIHLADGPLTTADVFNLDLRAQLVVLSACETGRAELGGGDELVGLTRAFLYAGAAGLLVSQWRVDDASTAGLMQCFYTSLARGFSPSQALRQAQMAQCAAAMPQSETTHPFFWAGFQFIGDGQGLKPRPARAAGGRRSV